MNPGTELITEDNTWVSGPDLPASYASIHTISVCSIEDHYLSERFLLFGGHITPTTSRSNMAFVYDWDLGTWTQLADLPYENSKLNVSFFFKATYLAA